MSPLSASPISPDLPISRFSLFRWWNSPAGGREMFKLALPMIISEGALAAMQFADRIFLTWFNPATVGASFVAGQFFWLMASFPFSVAAFVNAFVSLYNGLGWNGRIGGIVWQGILLGVILAPVFLLLFPIFPLCFRFFGNDPALLEMESVYLFWSIWGLGPLIANEALVAFFSGRKRMNIVMTVNLFAVFLNVVLDYFLIFGVAGYFRWGIAGAAIATTVSQWIRASIFFGMMVFEERRSGGKYGVWRGCRLIPSEFRRLLRFGGMGGVQFFIEVAMFSLFVLMIGRIGETATTASAIAFNLNALTFLPIVGTGTAVVTLVGNYLGEGKPNLAKKSAISATNLSLVFTGIFMILYLFFPDFLLSVYASGDPESFAPYHLLTKQILRFVAVYLFFDTFSMIFCSALKGAGDTRFIMIVSIATAPTLVIFTWLGIRFFGLGIFWAWTVLTTYICVLGVIFFLRFFSEKWLTPALLDRSSSLPDLPPT